MAKYNKVLKMWLLEDTFFLMSDFGGIAYRMKKSMPVTSTN